MARNELPFPVHGHSALLVGDAETMISRFGNVAAAAIAAVINLAAFGMSVFGHPVGAAFRAAQLVAINAGTGHSSDLPPKKTG